MNINFDFRINAIDILAVLIAWSVIGFIAYKIYKKQVEKPKVWKILIVTYVGLFAFTVNWNMFDKVFKLPILPLGVWILFFVLKGKGWQRYRPFAWLGFLGNFVFILSTLAAIPVFHAIYPENEPSTYISTIDHASIIKTHPSSKNRTLDNENLLKQLPTMKPQKIYSELWYQETYMSSETSNKIERFPYQLIGTATKWGSGLSTIIFIEKDGRGILIQAPKKQLYFRFKDSLLEEDE